MFVLIVNVAFFPGHLCSGLLFHLQVSEELKQHLNLTMTENYAQPGKDDITLAVDKLQQDVGANTLRSLPPQLPVLKPLPASTVQVLWQQQLGRLGDEPLRHIGSGGRQGGPRQLLQNHRPAVRQEGPPLQHLQSGGPCTPGASPALSLLYLQACCDVLLAFAGRLHLQVGAVPGGPPAGYRSGGDRSGLPAGKSESVCYFTVAV